VIALGVILVVLGILIGVGGFYLAYRALRQTGVFKTTIDPQDDLKRASWRREVGDGEKRSSGSSEPPNNRWRGP
jgi:hypothetical protein